MDRRAFLAALASAGVARAAAPPRGASPPLGVVIHSYGIRSRREKGFADPLRFLAFCHERGAAGVQVSIGVRDGEYVRRLRAFTERTGAYLEGSLRAPRTAAEVDRFDAEVRTAAEAGADVVRTVMLSGRRYEVFRSAADYRAFHAQARRSLELAVPVLERRRVRLAVENHKDFRADELADEVRRLGCRYVGVCLDTGNNLALLEPALETARVLAPWTFTVHLKDMAAEESADGFLLSEVPLGDGRLDVAGIVRVVRAANPLARFGLEMITRDPLRIPCLSEGYWATLGGVPGRDLARTLAWVKAGKGRLPRVTGLSAAGQVEAEERNVRRSLAWFRASLGR